MAISDEEFQRLVAMTRGLLESFNETTAMLATLANGHQQLHTLVHELQRRVAHLESRTLGLARIGPPPEEFVVLELTPEEKQTLRAIVEQR